MSSGTNQLGYVTDTVSAPAFTEDIDNQSSGNYKYDEIGNLIYDASEEIDTIKWNAFGKIQAVIRTAVSTRPDVEFEYDPMGQRTLKRVITKSETPRIIETLYIRDANGNEMATYTLVNDSVMWNSASIYGSSRVGVYEENRLLEVDSTAIPYLPADEQLAWKGYRKYELSNHLGNVLVVISDKRTTVCDGEDAVQYYEADIVSAQDYYPRLNDLVGQAFGMVMPGRSYSNGAYRFGFNGKEESHMFSSSTEIYDFGQRIYNSNLCRWLSREPLSCFVPYWSPYNFAGNKPIIFADNDGLWIEYVVKKYYRNRKGNLVEKKWFNFFRATVHKDITLKVHDLKIYLDGCVVTETINVQKTDENGNPLFDDDGNPVMTTKTIMRKPTEAEKEKLLTQVKNELTRYYSGETLFNNDASKSVTVKVEFATEPEIVSDLSEVNNFSILGHVDDLIIVQGNLIGQGAVGETRNRNVCRIVYDNLFKGDGTYAHEFAHERKFSILSRLIDGKDEDEEGVFAESNGVSQSPNFVNLWDMNRLSFNRIWYNRQRFSYRSKESNCPPTPTTQGSKPSKRSVSNARTLN